MGNESDDYTIKFTTEADTGGAEKAQSAIRGVGGEAEKAGSETKSFAEGLGDIGEAGEAAGEKTRGGMQEAAMGLKSAKLLSTALSLAMAGDLTGALKLATVGIKGLSLAMKANPMGLLIAGIGAAVALFAKFNKGADDATSATDNLAKASSKVEAAQAAMQEELAAYYEKVRSRGVLSEKQLEESKTAVDKVVASLKEATGETTAWYTALDAVIQRNAQLAKSEITLQVAKGDITEEEGARRTAKLENTSSQESLGAAIEAEQKKQETALAALAAATKRLETAEMYDQAARKELAEARSAVEDSLKPLGDENRIKDQYEQGDVKAASKTAREDATFFDYPEASARAAALERLVKARENSYFRATEAASATEEQRGLKEKATPLIAESSAKVADLEKQKQIASNQAQIAEIAADKAEAAKQEAERKNAEGELAKAKAAQHAARMLDLQNELAAAQLAVSKANKDSSEYRTGLAAVAAAKEKLAAYKGATEEEDGTATPGTRAAATLETESRKVELSKELEASRERASKIEQKERSEAAKEAQRSKTRLLDRELAQVDAEASSARPGSAKAKRLARKREEITGKIAREKAKARDGDDSDEDDDERAPRRRGSSGRLRIGGEDARNVSPPVRSFDNSPEAGRSFRQQFEPHLDFSSGRGNSASAGGGGAEGGGQALESAGSKAASLAGPIASLTSGMTTLCSSVDKMLSKLEGTLSGLTARVDRMDGQMT